LPELPKLPKIAGIEMLADPAAFQFSIFGNSGDLGNFQQFASCPP
jgi:hypothetical protein